MADDVLVPVRVTDGGSARLAWAEGMEFRVPESFLQLTRLSEHRNSRGDLRIPSRFSERLPDAAERLRRWAAFTDKPPASARMPVSYQRVPPWLRAALASVMGRWQRRRSDRWAAFPQWPLDLSADFLCDLAGDGVTAAAATPVLLTHDLDSPEGIANLGRDFLRLEEAAGARSVSFITPCAWPIDSARLAQVLERGHEIGVHGYDHSNRTPFLDPIQRRQRLEDGKRALSQYNVRGYRAPSLLRTSGMLHDLAELYDFDSSIPTSGGLFPVPNNGCASARPFQLEGIAEIPLSLPRDGSLRFLGYSAADIADLWIQCAERISRSGGVVVLLTHCEARFSGNQAMLAAYQRFLDHVAGSSRYTWSKPGDVLGRYLRAGA